MVEVTDISYLNEEANKSVDFNVRVKPVVISDPNPNEDIEIMDDCDEVVENIELIAQN